MSTLIACAPPAVALDPRVARAWPVLRGVASLPAGAVVIGLLGEVLRVREDGGVDQVFQGGLPHGGAAAGPAPGRCKQPLSPARRSRA